MEIITGYRGEPHITSAQDRATNQGCFGEGSYILDVGSKLEPEIISANEIRINDGVLSHQGCVANIAIGTYDSLTISNGSQGMKRADLIVARYTRDSETFVENVELVVIEGTPSSGTPSLPSYNEGNIQAGDSPVDMPLFRVNIDGVSVDSVDQIAENIRTQAETDTLVTTLNARGALTTDTTAASVSVPNGTWTLAMQKSVEAGTYVILYGGAFDTNANGVRLYSLNTNPTSPNSGRIVPLFPPVSGDQTRNHTVEIFNLATPATLYFRVRQTSGSSLDFYPMMKILKVR